MLGHHIWTNTIARTATNDMHVGLTTHWSLLGVQVAHPSLFRGRASQISGVIAWVSMCSCVFMLMCDFFISTNNEDIGQKFLPDHTLMLYKNSDLERSKFKVTPRIHWFSQVLLYLIN